MINASKKGERKVGRSRKGLYKLVQIIRQYTNKPLKQHHLLKDKGLWNQLCSSMNVIEDTELAIKSFVNKEFKEDFGILYLAVYGLLQSLFLQQDATKNLNESLGYGIIEFKNFQKLQTIRNIRNDAIGHPTKRNHRKSLSYHYISRATLNYKGFQLLTFYSNGSHQFKDIDISKCIADQNTGIRSILISIIDKLKKEETEHKQKFINEKLEDCFPQIVHYYFEKIYESISNPDKYTPDFGLVHLNLIRKAINDFQKALAKRNIDWETYLGVKDTCKDIEYPISKLENFFKSIKNGKSPRINKKDANIFRKDSRQHFKELIQIAHEIDEEYSRLL